MIRLGENNCTMQKCLLTIFVMEHSSFQQGLGTESGGKLKGKGGKYFPGHFPSGLILL